MPWVLHTEGGKTHLGLKMPESGDHGAATYSDPQGELFKLPDGEIEMRAPSDVSVMPAGLEKTLSVEDFRDLLAFLSGESNTSE
ncbi:hypothetical protein [Adhaeretor mobilis]|uniref:Uncharacterized protein n=1 Tax=Adhaeretor mobilis TaxID=1930276 RepID=A0A517MYL0_9BACT|nr:hypothetical protein [Adhaeretor mobilis]QDS99980.1 hypothetical protein HG15A2_33160 [Adhaeretor mobilis]